MEKQRITSRTSHPQSTALSTGRGLLQGRIARGLAAVHFCTLVPAHASHVASIPPSLQAPSPPERENTLLCGLIPYAPTSTLTASFPFISSFFITVFSLILSILTVPHHCPLHDAHLHTLSQIGRALTALFSSPGLSTRAPNSVSSPGMSHTFPANFSQRYHLHPSPSSQAAQEGCWPSRLQEQQAGAVDGWPSSLLWPLWQHSRDANSDLMLYIR